MPIYLGFDTSNYTTSVARYDTETGSFCNHGKLLPVPEGQLGLRQSDALFSHLKALPMLCAALAEDDFGTIAGIGVSTRPRNVEGSYMPCFVAGTSLAESFAALLRVPLVPVSHQEGHLASVLVAANRMDLFRLPFLAWHLSGGTTELLLVKPSGFGFSIEKIGGTSDISAGQLLDRTGGMLSLAFPSGRQLDELAQTETDDANFQVRLNGLYFSLSGVENQVRARVDAGMSASRLARFVLLTVASAVDRVTTAAKKQFGAMPLVLSGGVAGSSILREALAHHAPVVCAGQYASDNALGVAALAARREGGGSR